VTDSVRDQVRNKVGEAREHFENAENSLKAAFALVSNERTPGVNENEKAELVDLADQADDLYRQAVLLEAGLKTYTHGCQRRRTNAAKNLCGQIGSLAELLQCLLEKFGLCHRERSVIRRRR
jgi:hypothetical protein